ncbi:flavin monoamine oxidase family protein [Bacillus infantis]|uniref:flavin monoamine oxidase family protein n=1 Tax=Bacillus infantis TaxID=324767 RepID=UPI003CEB71F8
MDRFEMKQHAIAIIGAGLAGLTCAFRLKQAGIEAVVFESQADAGGRCRTNRTFFAEGQFAECGGEFIDSNHKEILGLISELGLQTDDLTSFEKKGGKPLYLINGKSIPGDKIEDLYSMIADTVKEEYRLCEFPPLYNRHSKRAKELDSMSIVDWINQNIEGGTDSEFGQLLCDAYTIEYGADCAEQSALNLISLVGGLNGSRFNVFGTSDERYRVRGGNGLIIEKLKQKLNGSILYDHQLTSIQAIGQGGYLLGFQSAGKRKEVFAGKVVMAIPFTVLRQTDYTKSGFSPLKAKAIEELGMGHNLKAHFQFSSRLWEKFASTGTIYTNDMFQSAFEATRAQKGEAGILVHYAGGKEAVRLMKEGKEMHKRRFLQDLSRLFTGAADQFNGRELISYWIAGSWTGGSYSFRKVGQHSGFAGVEMEKEGSCYFAGEHTSILYQGYMNGAVESGGRAALEVQMDLLDEHHKGPL